MNKLHRFATIAVLTMGLMMLAGCSGTNAPDDSVSSGQAADSSASATTGQDTNEFANNVNVIYEICNEPNGSTTWNDIAAYANEVIPVIRVNAPSAVTIVGTPTWSQRVDEAAANPLTFDSVMYALHFYAATHQQDLRDRMTAAVGAGLPIFVSEFGICDASGNGAIDYTSADAWVQLMDELHVSYICWNLSNKDEASALFKAGCAKTSGFDTADLSAEGTWLWAVLHGDEPDAKVDAWNGQFDIRGTTLHVTNVSYNGTIPAGESISDVGFIVSY